MSSCKICRFPDKPEEPLDLTNMIPASPLPSHNGFNPSQVGNYLAHDILKDYQPTIKTNHNKFFSEAMQLLLKLLSYSFKSEL